MKTIRIIILLTVFLLAISYVDIQTNKMFSEPKLTVFENFGNEIMRIIDEFRK